MSGQTIYVYNYVYNIYVKTIYKEAWKQETSSKKILNSKKDQLLERREV